VTARDVLEWIEHLRTARENGDSAINRAVTVVKCFFRAIVAMGHLEDRENPMKGFPRVKRVTRKFAETLDEEEVVKLLLHPSPDTIIGLRDRAIMSLLYGTGIRASECAGVLEKSIDLERATVQVRGKGGDERVVPLPPATVKALRVYREARGPSPSGAFFVSKKRRALTRSGLFKVVRSHARKAGLKKSVSPHRLRHACATHLIRLGTNLMDVQKILGHRVIVSTQIYVHMTARDLRRAADRHPVSALVDTIKDLLPEVKLNFMRPLQQRRV
jgi:site-specific recombinase XerD